MLKTLPHIGRKKQLPSSLAAVSGKGATERTLLVDLIYCVRLLKPLFTFVDFSYDGPLMDAGIPLRSAEQGKNVPMYKTNLKCRPAGSLTGNMVVSMKPSSSLCDPIMAFLKALQDRFEEFEKSPFPKLAPDGDRTSHHRRSHHGALTSGVLTTRMSHHSAISPFGYFTTRLSHHLAVSPP